MYRVICPLQVIELAHDTLFHNPCLHSNPCSSTYLPTPTNPVMTTPMKRTQLKQDIALATVTSAIHASEDPVSAEVAVIQLMEDYDFDLRALKASLMGMTLVQLF